MAIRVYEDVISVSISMDKNWTEFGYKNLVNSLEKVGIFSCQ